MIRGTQKRMVVVKTAESKCFEEAYFVVRRECPTGRDDMIGEANKIIEQLECGKRNAREERSGVFRNVALLVCGGGVGAMLTAILSLVVRLG